MMNEPIRSIMTKDLIKADPSSTLLDVKEVFDRCRIHHLPIVDGSTLCGLITMYDLWKLGKSFEEYANIKASDIMTTKLAVVHPDDKIGTAAELFLDNRFHALPVIENKKLVGIVTSFDVLKYEFLKEYPNPILFKEVLEGNIQMKNVS